MSVRVRVWVLEAAFVLLVLALLTTVPAAQRSREEVSPAVRLAITEATSVNTSAIAGLRTELAVVQKTAADAKEELGDLRRAIWAMFAALLLQLLTQIHQARKARNGA